MINRSMMYALVILGRCVAKGSRHHMRQLQRQAQGRGQRAVVWNAPSAEVGDTLPRVARRGGG